MNFPPLGRKGQRQQQEIEQPNVSFSLLARTVRDARVTVISRHEYANPPLRTHFQLTETESRRDGDRLAGRVHRPARLRHRASRDAASGRAVPVRTIRRRREGVVIGILFSIFSLMQFVFSPVWGRVSDRIGRKPVLIISLIGSVVFYALYGLAVTLPASSSRSRHRPDVALASGRGHRRGERRHRGRRDRRLHAAGTAGEGHGAHRHRLRGGVHGRAADRVLRPGALQSTAVGRGGAGVGVVVRGAPGGAGDLQRDAQSREQGGQGVLQHSADAGSAPDADRRASSSSSTSWRSSRSLSSRPRWPCSPRPRSACRWRTTSWCSPPSARC